MLYMVMHKVDEAIEHGRPDRKIIDAMGNLVGESIERGIFQDGAGLQRSSQRVRVRYTGGDKTATPGPLQGDNELLAGFVMLQVKSMDEAVDWAGRIAAAAGGGEVEVGPVVEAWDLGIAPKPEGQVSLRALALHKADAASERGAPEPAPLRQLTAAMRDAGVLLSAKRLQPSSHGVRLRSLAGKHSWIDGPFAESKELIAGFSIIRVDTLEEARAWTARYADCLGDCEVDVRAVLEG